jgi:anti-sigma B factor antagonist
VDFNLSITSRPPEALVRIQGELDLSTSSLVARRLRAASDEGCQRLLIDLSDVTFIDATALGMLTSTRRELAQRGGTLGFVAYGSTFLRLCRATGLAVPFGLDAPDTVADTMAGSSVLAPA